MRHRRVAGRSARHQLDRPRILFERLHRRVRRLAADAGHASAFGEAVFGVDGVAVLLRHEVDADRLGRRAALLARLRQKDHVAIERHLQPFQFQQDHQPGDDMRFVVERTARIDVPAVARRAERREFPLRGIHRDDVGVAHQQNRPLGAASPSAARPGSGGSDRARTADSRCPRDRAPASGSRRRAFRFPADCWCPAAAAPGNAASSRLRAPSSRACARPARSPRTNTAARSARRRRPIVIETSLPQVLVEEVQRPLPRELRRRLVVARRRVVVEAVLCASGR